jgi:hypothetical protein
LRVPVRFTRITRMDWLDSPQFAVLLEIYRVAGSGRERAKARAQIASYVREQIEADAYECVSAAYLLDASPQGNA